MGANIVGKRARNARQQIAIIGLGGTIVMKGGGRGASVSAGEFQRLLAGARGASGAKLSYEQFAAIPSCDLRFCDLRRLAGRIEQLAAAGSSGIVITQGTDVMEESAFALELLTDLRIPIVLTGAMRNPSLPGADGPANLDHAIAAASDPSLGDCGVLVLMNDELHAARFVRKLHTSSVAAFGSVVCGCVGFVAEGRVHKLTCLPPLAKVRLAEDAPIPRVGMHTVTLDDDGHLLTLAAGAGYDGLVVEAFGAGHVPSAMVDELGRLASMMPVVLASRAGAGVIFRQTYAFPGSEMDLIGRGLIPAGWLDGRKSRVALSLLLAGGSTGEEISAFFRSCGG